MSQFTFFVELLWGSKVAAWKSIDFWDSAPFTSHTSPTPTATATYLPHANSPTMYSKPVCQDRKFFWGAPAYLPKN